jgi:aldose 1-epimerase
MAFSIWQEDELFPVVYLKDAETNCIAEIYSRGALLNAFTITGAAGGFNIIDGFSSPAEAIEKITAGFKSAKLSPYVCRVASGRYSFEGTEYKLNKFYLGTEAIHGLIYEAPFTIISKGADSDSAWVTFDYTYNNNTEGYPFTYNTQVTYRLKKGGTLSITTEVTNTGDTNMPLADGWHPYFILGDTVNNAVLHINANQMLEFNDKLLPSGNVVAFSEYATPKRIGDTFFDNCFVVNQNSQPACTVTNPATGLKLTITASGTYPYLQVYTPPHRKSIAIENLSSAPDAFNNGIGLIIAKPGELHTFVNDCTVQLQV